MKALGMLMAALLLATPAFAGLPGNAPGDRVAFPETERLLRSASIAIPRPSDCKPDTLDRIYNYHYRRLSGSCGALVKLWYEAENARVEVSLGRFNGLDALDAKEKTDGCQSERRQDLYASGLKAVDIADRRVQAARKRVEEACRADRERYARDVQYGKQTCASTFNQGPSRTVAGVDQRLKKDLAEAEAEQKKYETTVAQNRAQYTAGLQSAAGCAGSLTTLQP